jgi:hypothetical protein
MPLTKYKNVKNNNFNILDCKKLFAYERKILHYSLF